MISFMIVSCCQYESACELQFNFRESVVKVKFEVRDLSSFF